MICEGADKLERNMPKGLKNQDSRAYLHDILVFDHVIDSNSLGTVLCRRAPYQGILQKPKG